MPFLSDPVALAAIVSFSGSLVLHKCADLAVTNLVVSAAAFLKAKTGRTPRPADHDADAMRSAPPDLVALARVVAAESPVLRRADRVRDALEGARVLWVDDHPGSVAFETQALQGLGVEVVGVTSTDQALGALKARPFDLVLSDVDRDGQADAGIQMARILHEQPSTAPVVLYLRDLDPSRGVPPYVFGITNRPDDLFHLVMDALERTRLPAPQDLGGPLASPARTTTP